MTLPRIWWFGVSIADILVAKVSDVEFGTLAGQRLDDALSECKRAHDFYDYDFILTPSHNHKWLFHIKIQPTLALDCVDIFIRRAQDNKCSYTIRHWPWGTNIVSYNNALLEFINPALEKP